MIDAIDEASSDEEFDEDDLTNGATGQALAGNIQELQKYNKLQYQTFSSVQSNMDYYTKHKFSINRSILSGVPVKMQL